MVETIVFICILIALIAAFFWAMHVLHKLEMTIREIEESAKKKERSL